MKFIKKEGGKRKYKKFFSVALKTIGSFQLNSRDLALTTAKEYADPATYQQEDIGLIHANHEQLTF